MSDTSSVFTNARRKDDIVSFLRKRDYRFVRYLGKGASGETALLHDDQIDEPLVCKKYVPYSDEFREELFNSFKREIKLLHHVFNDNVVRLYNYYLYPERFAGYILMEYVDGLTLDEYIKQHPERTNDVFLQAIKGFTHLEGAGVLHRDIRPANILVRSDGVLKIIDLGFGKRIVSSADFKKSITLNWHCEPPDEFNASRYDFRTEVYFVGNLFRRLIREHAINHFKYATLLNDMCQPSPGERVSTFSAVESIVRQDPFMQIAFTDEEISVYRDFSAAIVEQVSRIANATRYQVDVGGIQQGLNDAYRTFMLEKNVPDASVVLKWLLDGAYYYKKTGLPVRVVRDFLSLFKTITDEKRHLILANLHAKLAAVPRYEPVDEVPF